MGQINDSQALSDGTSENENERNQEREIGPEENRSERLRTHTLGRYRHHAALTIRSPTTNSVRCRDSIPFCREASKNNKIIVRWPKNLGSEMQRQRTRLDTEFSLPIASVRRLSIATSEDLTKRDSA
jgi:hypothetical protein